MHQRRQRNVIMLHLDPERLAALADSEPTTEEATHLATCAKCARERSAYRELVTRAAGERTTILAQPLTDWESLSKRLRAEGMTRTNVLELRRGQHPWLRVAAGV